MPEDLGTLKPEMDHFVKAFASILDKIGKVWYYMGLLLTKVTVFRRTKLRPGIEYRSSEETTGNSYIVIACYRIFRQKQKTPRPSLDGVFCLLPGFFPLRNPLPFFYDLGHVGAGHMRAHEGIPAADRMPLFGRFGRAVQKSEMKSVVLGCFDGNLGAGFVDQVDRFIWQMAGA